MGLDLVPFPPFEKNKSDIYEYNSVYSSTFWSGIMTSQAIIVWKKEEKM